MAATTPTATGDLHAQVRELLDALRRGERVPAVKVREVTDLATLHPNPEARAIGAALDKYLTKKCLRLSDGSLTSTIEVKR